MSFNAALEKAENMGLDVILINEVLFSFAIHGRQDFRSDIRKYCLQASGPRSTTCEDSKSGALEFAILV